MGADAWIAILVIDAIVSAYICGMVAGEKGYTVWSAVCLGFLFGALAVIVYWDTPYINGTAAEGNGLPGRQDRGGNA